MTVHITRPASSGASVQTAFTVCGTVEPETFTVYGEIWDDPNKPLGLQHRVILAGEVTRATAAKAVRAWQIDFPKVPTGSDQVLRVVAQEDANCSDQLTVNVEENGALGLTTCNGGER